MKKCWSSLLAIVMVLNIFTFIGGAEVQAATFISKYEAESMKKAGSYTSNISSPFTGVALYANKDLVKNSTTFATIPGKYELRVRGASSNSSAAGVSVYVGGSKKASLSFTGTTPAIQSVLFDVTGTSSQEVQLKLETDNGSNDTLIDYYELYFDSVPALLPPAPVPPTTGAFDSGVYRNLFKEFGKSDAEIDAKVNTAFQQLFYGDNDTQRIYYPVGTDMAYILDKASNDVRSEGMSYGMMIAVQLDKKAEFDRLWKWAKTYMQNTSGSQQGYFAWQVDASGNKIDTNPASDGEEYFITALLFAANRWGSGTGIYNYSTEAQTLLDRVLTPNGDQKTLFDLTQKQVVFVPYGSAAGFSDPSYHLPAFYELWALWDNNNNQFWRDAAATSREFFKKQAHSTTGLGPDYAEFDGRPNNTGNHGDFRFDAWRTIMNVAMDYHWFAKDSWQTTYADRVQSFFHGQGIGAYANQYSLSGSSLSADHSPGLVATNAVGTLAATTTKSWEFVNEFWNTSIPSGQYRYYDGCLYMMSLLHASGKFKIYKPSGGGTNPPSSDTQVPTAPTGLSSPSKSDTSVSLTWNASSDNIGVTGYEIFHGTTPCGTTASTSFTCTELSPDTSYSFTVKARDAAGNVSALSSALSVTTNASSGSSSETILWSDSFESGSSNWSNFSGNWSVVTDLTKVYSSGGVYDTGVSRVQNQSWSNYSYEAKVKVQAVNTGNRTNLQIGIAGRLQNQNNFYIAYFNGSQSIVLAKVVNGSWTTVGSYPGNYTEDSYHTVKLSMLGTGIKVSVDGTERISTTDAQFASGTIGVFASQGTGQFDDVKISQ